MLNLTKNDWKANVKIPSHVIIRVQVSPTIETRPKLRYEAIGKQLKSDGGRGINARNAL